MLQLQLDTPNKSACMYLRFSFSHRVLLEVGCTNLNVRQKRGLQIPCPRSVSSRRSAVEKKGILVRVNNTIEVVLYEIAKIEK